MILIVAPHPDDEWIGCGCTLLKALDDKKQVKVLLITQMDFSMPRVKTSCRMAKRYGYILKELKQPEKKINVKKLDAFLKKEIKKNDVIYMPDFDIHPDHKVIASACMKLGNKKIQYCVYNNSRNVLRRIWHKVLSLLFNRGYPSFRNGKADKVFSYKLSEKMKNIEEFGEFPRDGDVLRESLRRNS